MARNSRRSPSDDSPMNTSKKLRRQSRNQPRPLVALSLAEEAAAALGAAGPEREEFVTAAMCVGQWLAEQGRPGRWDTVDPAAVLDLMCFADQQQADAFLLTLVALFGHAGLNQHLPADDAARTLLQIRELSSNRVISELAGDTARQLAG